MEYQIKKIEAKRYHVIRPDGTVKSTHENEEKALKSIAYAKAHYLPKGRGKIN
jgi:hypothetical protein